MDGKLLHARSTVYIALHKPDSVVTTVSDPQGRTTVMDLLHGVKERVYPVGRLDYHSEGLLLLTNDGELANAITSAATHLPKTYLVKVNGTLTPEQEEHFRDGVPLSRAPHAAGGSEDHSRGGEPLVRSEAGRRPEQADPDHVQTFRAAGREAEARAHRADRARAAEAWGVPTSRRRRSEKLNADTAKRERTSHDDGSPEILQSARVDRGSGVFRASATAPSYGVAEYMQCAGYRIIPVNPQETEVLGEKAIRIWMRFRRQSISSISSAVPSIVPEIVEAAIRMGAKAIWMQEDVVHEDAARRARGGRSRSGDGPLHSKGTPAAGVSEALSTRFDAVV